MNNLQAAKNRLSNQLDFLKRQRVTIAQMEAAARTSDQRKATEFARLSNEDNINCITATLRDLEAV